MSGEICLLAPAKINLGLDVISRRPDGYHEIRTVLQSIALTDRIVLRDAAGVTVTCAALELADEVNLVQRAAGLLRERHAPGRGADILLEKTIPIAAGLGGGSSDAAATLVGLDRLWDLRLPDAELTTLAAELGSDVAFFLKGGTALATGRGEMLEPLAPLPPAWVISWLPPLRIPRKTGYLYGRIRDQEKRPTADFDRILETVRRGRWPPGGGLHNTFQAVYVREYPVLGEWLARADALTGLRFSLSGAGPALFAFCADAATARRTVDRLNRPAAPAWIVQTCDQSPLRCP